MSKTILFLLIVNSFSAFAQNKLAVYEVLFKVENQKRSSEFFNQITEASKNLEFELLFNDSISQFSVSKKLNLEGIDLAASKIISKGIYYYNKRENKNIIINEGFFYKKELLSNWILHNEEKLINNYKCFKATVEKTVTNSKGTFKHIVTAWYCPEIPYNFGPNGYNGLPGLIFELIELPANHFILKTLSLKNTSNDFLDLNRYKEVSEEDYITSIKSNLPSRRN